MYIISCLISLLLFPGPVYWKPAESGTQQTVGCSGGLPACIRQHADEAFSGTVCQLITVIFKNTYPKEYPDILGNAPESEKEFVQASLAYLYCVGTRDTVKLCAVFI